LSESVGEEKWGQVDFLSIQAAGVKTPGLKAYPEINLDHWYCVEPEACVKASLN